MDKPKRILILTGSPGIGKTTVIQKTTNSLAKKGKHVGGMISQEVRQAGRRVGFQITNVSSGKQGWLAHIQQKTGPKLGKYRINLADLDSVGVNAIEHAVANCEVVVLDEIGPMELCSEKFKKAACKALDFSPFLIVVVHQKAVHNLVVDAKSREDAQVFTVTLENRESLPDQLTLRAVEFFGAKF